MVKQQAHSDSGAADWPSAIEPSSPSPNSERDKDGDYIEIYLRETWKIPPPLPLNLFSLPDDNPPGANNAALIELAIWGSPRKKCTISQIRAAVMERYPSFIAARRDQAWFRTIRHDLSKMTKYHKSDEKPANGKGCYWELDASQLHRYRPQWRTTKVSDSSTSVKSTEKVTSTHPRQPRRTGKQAPNTQPKQQENLTSRPRPRTRNAQASGSNHPAQVDEPTSGYIPRQTMSGSTQQGKHDPDVPTPSPYCYHRWGIQATGYGPKSPAAGPSIKPAEYGFLVIPVALGSNGPPPPPLDDYDPPKPSLPLFPPHPWQPSFGNSNSVDLMEKNRGPEQPGLDVMEFINPLELFTPPGRPYHLDPRLRLETYPSHPFQSLDYSGSGSQGIVGVIDPSLLQHHDETEDPGVVKGQKRRRLDSLHGDDARIHKRRKRTDGEC